MKLEEVCNFIWNGLFALRSNPPENSISKESRVLPSITAKHINPAPPYPNTPHPPPLSRYEQNKRWKSNEKRFNRRARQRWLKGLLLFNSMGCSWCLKTGLFLIALLSHLEKEVCSNTALMNLKTRQAIHCLSVFLSGRIMWLCWLGPSFVTALLSSNMHTCTHCRLTCMLSLREKKDRRVPCYYAVL